MEINSWVLKLSGDVELPPMTEYEIGQDVNIAISGQIIAITEKDNQDGTKDRVFKVKGIMLH